jgi:D-alanyl-D-alanine carboxypeptidase
VIAVMLGGATSKSRNEHVKALVEAAFATLAGPADPSSPQLRGTIEFASVKPPANPNAAAEPMLNGVPFSAFQTAAVNLTLAQASAEQVTDDMVLVEGDSADDMASVQPSPALPAPGASFSVSEYEARQVTRADAAADLAAYVRRQTRR